jgi:hypothetical protein
MKPAEISARYQKQTVAIAQKFYRSIYQREFARPSFLSLMMFKIQQGAWRRRTDEDTVDTRYWKNKGWLEPECDFYIPHQANRVKVVLARLTGAVIARFVT